MRIDIFHDTVCPWCRIGKHHLSRALQEWNGPVELHYRSFFLDATVPPEGRNFRKHMIAKGAGRITLEQFFDGPRRAGAAVGLTFNFEAIEWAPNTTLSHQLIYLTPDTQREQMIEAIYVAYFEHAQNIGDIEVLMKIAATQGMDADEIRIRLDTGEGHAPVMQDVTFAQQAGISGVPMFVFDNMFALSGAHPSETLLNTMKQVQMLAPGD